jgi:type VI protein secretion system component VasF
VSIIRRVLIALSSFALVAAPALAFQAPAAQDGFVPINELPPGERLPAAPFLIGAYAFFLVLMIAYIWSIARRLNHVQHEMKVLEQRTTQGSGRQ